MSKFSEGFRDTINDEENRDQDFCDNDAIAEEGLIGLTDEDSDNDDDDDIVLDECDEDKILEQTLAYDGNLEDKFDLTKAQAMFAEDKESSKIRAIKYAYQYAHSMKKDNNKEDAKRFIVKIVRDKTIYMNIKKKLGKDASESDIYAAIKSGFPDDIASIKQTMSLSKDVRDTADTAFFFFFRNYLRRIVVKYYSIIDLNADERHMREDEALQELWAQTYHMLERYDNRFSLTTYINKTILRGTITALDAKRRHITGNRDKSELAATYIVAKKNLEQKLLREPTNTEIFEELQKTKPGKFATLGKLSQVIDYVNIENNIQSDVTKSLLTDDDESLTITDAISQNVFPEPERDAIETEINDALYSALSFLSEIERAAILLLNGLEMIENKLYTLKDGPWKASRFESAYKLSFSEARQTYERARSKMEKKMKPYYNKKREQKLVSHDGGFLFFKPSEDIEWNEALLDMSRFTPD